MDQNSKIVKFFRLAKKKFKDFPFEELTEFIEHMGEKPVIYGQDVYVVLKNYDKPSEKKQYTWGTRSDEMKARRNRKKTYIWSE